jgi:hypothetical protein
MSRIVDYVKSEPLITKALLFAGGILGSLGSQGDWSVAGIIAAVEVAAALFIRQHVSPEVHVVEDVAEARIDGFIEGEAKGLEADAAKRRESDA